MASLLEQIEREVNTGTFDYQRYFPNSKRAAKFAAEKGGASEVATSG